jgi:hypothetical protein
MAYDKSGNKVIERSVTREQLPNVIGKEATQKLVESKLFNEGQRIVSGVDLKVGGEGMKGFYDQILPKEISKYVKQWGGQVEKSGIGSKTRVLNPSDFMEWHRGQNPNAQMIIGAMMAHIQEHVGYEYRRQMEEMIGTEFGLNPETGKMGYVSKLPQISKYLRLTEQARGERDKVVTSHTVIARKLIKLQRNNMPTVEKLNNLVQ